MTMALVARRCGARTTPRIAVPLGTQAQRVAEAPVPCDRRRCFAVAARWARPGIVSNACCSPLSVVRRFATVLNCPELGGESITEGTIMEWKKKVGEQVSKDEVICVVETDKVTVEVKAQADGALQEILVKPDETIQVGQPMAKIGAAGAAPAASAPAPAPSASAAPGGGKVIEQKVADFGAESITEGTMMELKKNVGDFVTKGEIVAVIETDKVSVEVKAEESGTIKEIAAKADETVVVGQLLFKIETGAAPSGAGAAAPAPAAATTAAPAAADTTSHGPPLTGLRATFARLAAKRLGLPDPTAPAPVAPAPAPAAPAPAAAAAAAAPTAVPTTGKAGRTERRVPISFIRKQVMQRMKDAQNTAALLSTFQEADMSAMIQLREKYKDVFMKAHGTPLGFLSIYAKASALALLEEPGVNAVIDESGKETIYRDYVDLSVPIPSPRGPVSCVLRNVESKTIFDLETEIAGLMTKARKDELSVDDLSSPTFGIVDTGGCGGMYGTGLINPPQSAVLGTNAITPRPVAVGGKVEARPVMYMNLTYDHRLIDGREAVTFLVSVRDKLEDPSRMLLGI